MGTDEFKNMSDTVPETYTEYESNHNGLEFTDWLRESAEPEWTRMLEHQFVKELSDGTIDDGVFERYLIQEWAFVKTAASVFGYAVGKAPSFEEKQHLTAVLTGLTNEQAGYFTHAFDAYDVPPERRSSPDLPQDAYLLQELVLRAAADGGYEEALAPMAAAEWLYLMISRSAEDNLTNRPHINEWIDLHVTEEFENGSKWLRARLDEYGPELPEYRQRQVRQFFCRAVSLEITFHDAPYQEW